MILNEFLIKYDKKSSGSIWPSGSAVNYLDGRVKCGVHSVDKGKEDDGDVPYI